MRRGSQLRVIVLNFVFAHLTEKPIPNLVIALPAHVVLGHQTCDIFQLLPAQRKLKGSDVIVQMADLRRTGYGNNIVALRSDPCQGQLRRRDSFLLRNGPEPLRHGRVLRDVLRREPRVPRRPQVPGLEVPGARQVARQQRATQGGVRDDADAELAARRQQGLLEVAVEEGPLLLYGGNRADRVESADVLRAELRDAYVPRQAGLQHGPEGGRLILCAHAVAEAVGVVEVHAVHLEALATGAASGEHRLWRGGVAVQPRHVLCGNLHFTAR
mmetsp:Transcript_57720/g.115637  ORF Transcript_57720/g.115637 Transcript_57720/m.115637 type:complete len:271 (-) Transcript_57720:249-1061(-)